MKSAKKDLNFSFWHNDNYYLIMKMISSIFQVVFVWFQNKFMVIKFNCFYFYVILM